MEIFGDLQDEQDRLSGILAGLSEAQWLSPSDAAGWTVADVVLHLAQTDELAAARASGEDTALRWNPAGTEGTVDELADQLVAAQRAAPAAVLARWEQARQASMAALRAADPKQSVAWVAGTMRPATLATTRLAEHWAHGLDIAGPLGISLPDTARLRHIAWLAHRTLPYAYALAGDAEPPEVRCELTAPDGTATWLLGPPGADDVITGPAGAFCRVAAQRLAPAQSGLQASGPRAAEALGLLRSYAA